MSTTTANSMTAQMRAQASVPTHQALLEAAERLFSERGYASVGIRDIADEAGANIASIKYHFGSKEALYLETVRCMMSRGDAEAVWRSIDSPPRDPANAAVMLAKFIHGFLTRLLATPEGGRCARIIIQEAMQPTEATDAVVRDYFLPRQRRLKNLISAIAPRLNDRQLAMMAQTVLAQILYYRMFQPFLQRMHGIDLTGRRQIATVARQIVHISLRAMDCKPVIVRRAAAAISPSARMSSPATPSAARRVKR